METTPFIGSSFALSPPGRAKGFPVPPAASGGVQGWPRVVGPFPAGPGVSAGAAEPATRLVGSPARVRRMCTRRELTPAALAATEKSSRAVPISQARFRLLWCPLACVRSYRAYNPHNSTRQYYIESRFDRRVAHSEALTPLECRNPLVFKGAVLTFLPDGLQIRSPIRLLDGVDSP